MKTTGFNKTLCVLPFDHRGSFVSRMFGWHGTLTPLQTHEVAAVKQLVYEGFKLAVASEVNKTQAAILVDEQFGGAILKDAKAHSFITACPVEKSGQDEFDFEYGDDFPRHIESIQPTFCKVLVRYNPEGDADLNRRQVARLRLLSDYLRRVSPSRLMFELLVPAEDRQLARLDGSRQAYDLQVRPQLMVQTILELQDADIEPDVWKLEGLDRPEDCEKLVAVARRDGRDQVGCIVLGRGENDQKVKEWLKIASAVPGFIGFAVGRTVFWEPLSQFRTGRLTRDGAVSEIARRYLELVRVYENGSSR